VISSCRAHRVTREERELVRADSQQSPCLGRGALVQAGLAEPRPAPRSRCVLVPDHATASYRQNSRPRPGQHLGLAPSESGVSPRRTPASSTRTRDGRPATAAMTSSSPARMASPGRYCGPVGLVRKFAAASSRGARGLIPGHLEASSRQSSVGRVGGYKGSPPSPPRPC
jgi:hypothetical protein